MRITDENNNNFRAIPIFFDFLCMGFGVMIRPLVSIVKESFEVSKFQAQLMTFSGFIIFSFVADQSNVIVKVCCSNGSTFIYNFYNLASSNELI